MAKKKEKELITQRVKTLYDNGTSWKQSHLELNKQIKRSINFVEGRQWTNEEGTEDYPKITLNYMKMIMKVRQSNILQNDYNFLVNTMKFGDTKKIQYFLKFLYNQCRIKKKNLKVIKDNFLKGTSGLYFYWDNDARAILDSGQGTLKCEVFDIRNLVVADPSIQDIQDQEWLIYTLREKVGALKHAYPQHAEEIYSDGYYDRKDTESEQVGEDSDDELCNVYIFYYRNEEGQVCYTIHTQYVQLCDPTFLNPEYEGSYEEQPNTLSLNDEVEEKKFSREVFGLYPFAVYVMDERDNTFYGNVGAYEYIEAQKSINAHMATYDYAIQNNVLGGYMYRKGVLGDQEIGTGNGQVLELDLLPNENIGNVIGRLPASNVPQDSLNFQSILGGSLQQVSGATNVQMGQADFSNQTAQATQMLMARAKENSSDYAIMFEEYMKDVARIMFMFAKFFYKHKEFTIVEHGISRDTSYQFTNDEQGQANPMGEMGQGMQKGGAFNGEDYIEDTMDFDIQVTPSSAFSESQIYNLGMMCVQTGKLTMLELLDMLPYNTFPSYQEMKSKLSARDELMQKLQQTMQQVQQQQQVMEQMNQAYQQTQKDLKTMDTITRENNKLKREMGEFQAESIRVAQEAKEQVVNTTNDMTKLLNIVNRQNSKGGEQVPQEQPPKEVPNLEE